MLAALPEPVAVPENPTEIIDAIVADLGVKCAGANLTSLLFVPLSEKIRLPEDILPRIKARLVSDPTVRRILSEFPKLKTIQIIAAH